MNRHIREFSFSPLAGLSIGVKEWARDALSRVAAHPILVVIGPLARSAHNRGGLVQAAVSARTLAVHTRALAIPESLARRAAYLVVRFF